MSNVYLEDGTAVPVLRYDMSVTVEDRQTQTVLWSGDVPVHLAEHYSTAEAAEWATQWVDAAYGLSVADYGTEEDVERYGWHDYSLTLYYYAGARYLITVNALAKGKGYTVTHHGHTDVFLSESDAFRCAYYAGQHAILGTTEVTL